MDHKSVNRDRNRSLITDGGRAASKRPEDCHTNPLDWRSSEHGQDSDDIANEKRSPEDDHKQSKKSPSMSSSPSFLFAADPAQFLFCKEGEGDQHPALDGINDQTINAETKHSSIKGPRDHKRDGGGTPRGTKTLRSKRLISNGSTKPLDSAPAMAENDDESSIILPEDDDNDSPMTDASETREANGVHGPADGNKTNSADSRAGVCGNPTAAGEINNTNTDQDAGKETGFTENGDKQDSTNGKGLRSSNKSPKSPAAWVPEDSKVSAEDKVEANNDGVASEQEPEDEEVEQAQVKKLPRYMDRETMRLVKEYLVNEYEVDSSSNNGIGSVPSSGICDEDEIAGFMLRMNRHAEQQTSFVVHHRMAQKALLGKNEGNGALSDEEETDTAHLVEEFVRLEEEQSLGRGLFHEMAQSIQKAKGPAPTSNKKKKSNGVLDKRTISWLKKSAGVHTKNEAASSNHQHPAIKSIIEDQGRRFTRGMARQHHDKRQKRKKPGDQIGLEALTLAIDEMEEIGGYVFSRPKRNKKKKPPPEDDEDILTQVAHPDAPSRTKRPRTFEGDVSREGKKKKGDKSKRTKRGAEKEEKADSRSKPATPKTLSMRLEDWKLRKDESKEGKLEALIYGEDSYDPVLTQQPSGLPESYLKEGLALRLPAWPVVNPRRNFLQGTKQEQQQQPRPSRHHQYASYCSLIMKHLSGKARSWTRHEFFYGDLDKAWYNRNDFVRKAAKLGVPPNSVLTANEWKVVRARITGGKPRRFSKAFLEEQRRDRDRYRKSVRLVQTCNGNLDGADLDWDEPVPTLIPAGSVVTAFNSRYRILQRGVVLSYETARNKYFIRFPPGYGNLFCPDYEVSRHGQPEFLLPSRTTTLGDSTRQLAGGSNLCMSFPMSGQMGLASGLGNASAPTKSWGRKELSQAGMNWDNPRKNVASETPVEKTAEREMVALIVGTLEDAAKRKNMILSCLEQIESSVALKKASQSSLEHIAWLLANLDACNVVIEQGAYYMRSLYGAFYHPQHYPPQRPSKGEVMTWLLSVRGNDAKQTSPEDELSADYVGPSPAVNPTRDDQDEWSKRLILDSEDICRHFLTTGSQESDIDGDALFAMNRVASLGTLLLSSTFIEKHIRSFVAVHGLEGMYSSQAEVLNRVASETNTEAIAAQGLGNVALDQYGQVVANQKTALDELKDAIDAWNAEVAVTAL